MFGIRRKTKEERINEKREKILENYIIECRKKGFPDGLIIAKLRTINAPDTFLAKYFQLNLIKEVINMPKATKEKDYEEEDEEVEESEEDEDTDESEEEEEEKPKKKVKVEKKEDEEETKVSIVDIVRNHEERLRNLESAIFRLKAI